MRSVYQNTETSNSDYRSWSALFHPSGKFLKNFGTGFSDGI